MTDADGEGAQAVADRSVVELHESGMPWEDIADELGTTVDEAMARYRSEAYEHWDTGWEIDANDGSSHVTTGEVELWVDGGSVVQIEELTDQVPLTIVVENDETRAGVSAPLTAEKARELAVTLNECADILEGNA